MSRLLKDYDYEEEAKDRKLNMDFLDKHFKLKKPKVKKPTDWITVVIEYLFYIWDMLMKAFNK